MAHIKSILVSEGSNGSIGNITLRTLAGALIASQKTGRKPGPFTLPQVLHQVRFANIIHAFTQLNRAAPDGKGMSDTFPDRPKGLSNQNIFTKLNFALPAVAAVAQTKDEAAAGLLVPAPFIVSRGPLPSITPFFTLLQPTLTNPASIITPVTDLPPDPQPTMGRFYTALATAIAPFGVQILQGDTLTLFVLAYKPTDSPDTKILLLQFLINLTSPDPLPAYLQTLSDGHLSINLHHLFGISGYNIDIAPILGRSTPDGHLISNSQFSDNMLTSDAYRSHTTPDKAMEAALTYGYKDNPFIQPPN